MEHGLLYYGSKKILAVPRSQQKLLLSNTRSVYFEPMAMTGIIKRGSFYTCHNTWL